MDTSQDVTYIRLASVPLGAQIKGQARHSAISTLDLARFANLNLRALAYRFVLQADPNQMAARPRRHS